VTCVTSLTWEWLLHRILFVKCRIKEALVKCSNSMFSFVLWPWSVLQSFVIILFRSSQVNSNFEKSLYNLHSIYHDWNIQSHYVVLIYMKMTSLTVVCQIGIVYPVPSLFFILKTIFKFWPSIGLFKVCLKQVCIVYRILYVYLCCFLIILVSYQVVFTLVSIQSLSFCITAWLFWIFKWINKILGWIQFQFVTKLKYL